MDNSEAIMLKFDIEVFEPNTLQQLIPSLFIDFLQLVLYQRSQIPQPVQLLKRSIKSGSSRNNENENKKNKSIERKKQIYNNNTLLLLEKIDNLKLCLIKCFENYKNQIYEMSVFLGATPLTVKEAFSIQIKDKEKGLFKYTGSMAEYDCIEPPHKIVQFYSKKLCILLIENDVATTKTLPCSKAHIFIKTTSSFVPFSNMKPWPKFRFPLKQLKLVVETELFYPIPSTHNDSFINQTNNLTLSDRDVNQIFDENEKQFVCNCCNKVNKIQPTCFTAEEAVEIIALQSPENAITAPLLKQVGDSKHIKHCSCFQEKTTSTSKKVIKEKLNLSASEVLQEILNGPEKEFQKETVNNKLIKNESDFPGKREEVQTQLETGEFVWYQLPFAFKGFTS